MKPRRKVVSAKHSGWSWANRFTCNLECGHTVRASGRWVDEYKKTANPPATVACRKCPDKPDRVKSAPTTLANVTPPRDLRTQLGEA